LTKKAGLNRFTWDFRYDGAGPLAVPGKYQLRLSGATPESWTQTQSLEVALDPRLVKDGVTLADLKEQLDLLLNIRETASDARRTVQKLNEAAQRLAQQGNAAEKTKQLQTIRARLVTASGAYPQPMLIDQLSSLSRMAGSADRKVGRSAIEYFDVLRKQLDGIKADLARLVSE
jgi:hypothetical protein